MKSEKNIKYQRDTMVELAKMSINSVIKDIESNKITKDNILNYTYNIQNIINTAKVLDWIYNTDDSYNIDDYYDSSFENNLEKELNIDYLNNLLSNKELI